MKLLSVARTDVGRRRQVNEDALFRDDARGFYVVADGVGGHNKGEIASREAVEQLRMWVYGASRDLDRLVDRMRDGDDESVWEIRRLLESGVKSACYMVYGMAELDPEK
ncbi:MAG: PP2C family protein-serine/threonine phosphatase, partial [bacterium]